MRIPIVYSLPTRRSRQSKFVVTDEDTEVSARKVQEALVSKGVQAQLVPISEDGLEDIKKLQGDCIVNLIEWDDGDLPLTINAFDYLESLEIPITGADKENYIMTTDKKRMKDAFDLFNLPTAKWQLFTNGEEVIRSDFSYPVLVKLTETHCSVGLTKDAIAHSPAQLKDAVFNRLKTFSQPILAEEFIIGREFQITVLNRPSGVCVLPVAEVFFGTDDPEAFLTFDTRWNPDDPRYKASSMRAAELSPTQQKLLESVSLETFTKLKFRDYSRLDVRMRKEDTHDAVYLLEANSNPGLDEDPDYGMTISYKAVGMTFADFVWEIVESALRRAKKD